MNYALILAAGVGQRMRNAGLPKQFLKINGKPIIVYTLEKFEECKDIDGIVIVCREGYTDYLKSLLKVYDIKKSKKVLVGGKDRQKSLMKGLEAVKKLSKADDDVVVIHDGVRPLISPAIIRENIRMAGKFGAAMTVHPVLESVTVTEEDTSQLIDIKARAQTYSLTAPQSFRIADILDAYYMSLEEGGNKKNENEPPLLDAAMVYAKYKGKIYMVKDSNANIKITTPEDVYYLKSMFEMEETKFIFGI